MDILHLFFSYVPEVYVRSFAASTLKYRTLFRLKLFLFSFDPQIRLHATFWISLYWGWKNKVNIVAILIFWKISKNKIFTHSVDSFSLIMRQWHRVSKSFLVDWLNYNVTIGAFQMWYRRPCRFFCVALRFQVELAIMNIISSPLRLLYQHYSLCEMLLSVAHGVLK